MGVFYAVFDGVFTVVATGNHRLIFEFDEGVVLSWGVKTVAGLFYGNSPLLSVRFFAACIDFSANVNNM